MPILSVDILGLRNVRPAPEPFSDQIGRSSLSIGTDCSGPQRISWWMLSIWIDIPSRSLAHTMFRWKDKQVCSVIWDCCVYSWASNDIVCRYPISALHCVGFKGWLHIMFVCVHGIQWSFGVLLWELLTRGAKPYESVVNERIRRYIQDGNRLSKPSPMTPDFAYVSTTFRHS